MTDAYTLDKWKKVKTVGDYLDLLEDPNTNWQNLLDTFIDKSKSGFWLAGNIKNLPPTKLSTPAIHNDELNKETMTKPEMVMHEANIIVIVVVVIMLTYLRICQNLPAKDTLITVFALYLIRI